MESNQVQSIDFKEYARRRPWWVAALALLAFAFPFIAISCGGAEIGTVSGWQLVFGTSLSGEEISPEPTAVVAFVAAIGALLAGIALNGRLSAVLSGIGFASLIIFWFRGQAAVADSEGMLSISPKIGYGIAIVAFALGAYLSWTAEKSTGDAR